MNRTIQKKQKRAVAQVKKDITEALQILELDNFVSLKDIEREVALHETAFESLLLLGIMRRAMHWQSESAIILLLPGLTNWKNYLPHKELGGHTPFEHKELYPPGEHEAYLMHNLLEEYSESLQHKTHPADGFFDVEKDSAAFQESYFNSIPATQPFARPGDDPMSVRQIIIEERKRSNHPPETIDSVGIHIFAENTPEGLGWRMGEVEAQYMDAVEDLALLQDEPQEANTAAMVDIQKTFAEIEPYFRCAPEPHRFYCNYANALLLAGDTKASQQMIKRSLHYDPTYAPAKQLQQIIRQQR